MAPGGLESFETIDNVGSSSLKLLEALDRTQIDDTCDLAISSDLYQSKLLIMLGPTVLITL